MPPGAKDEPQEPTVERTASNELSTKPRYDKRKWRGLDSWKCVVGECAYDTFDEADLEPHWQQVHGPNAVVVPGPTPS